MSYFDNFLIMRSEVSLLTVILFCCSSISLPARKEKIFSAVAIFLFALHTLLNLVPGTAVNRSAHVSVSSRNDNY